MEPENGLSPEGRKVLEGYLEQARRRTGGDTSAQEWAVIERRTRSQVSDELKKQGRHDALAVLEALDNMEPAGPRAATPITPAGRVATGVGEAFYFLLYLALYGAAVSMIFGGLLRWILPNRIRLFAHGDGLLGLVLASPDATRASEWLGSWSATIAFFGGLALFIVANRLLKSIRLRTGIALSAKQKAAREARGK